MKKSLIITAPTPATLIGRIRGRAKILSISVLCLLAGGAYADTIYNAGPLEFVTNDQSMWSEGAAFQLNGSTGDALITGWGPTTSTFGGIIGSKSTTTINTNPLWWAWKACKETIDFLCGGQPSKGAEQLVLDTRTGAKVDLTTSGAFGFELGYTVDGGSVNATADFSAEAIIPDARDVKIDQFFNLNPTATLDDGSLSSQSPTAKAFINAIAKLEASVSAQACVILAGCVQDSANLVNINETLELVSIDPNAIEILPNLLPDANGDINQPLASVALFNQKLTLEGALSAAIPPVPGFKLTTSQFTIINTTPPTPTLTVELASLEVFVPDIVTTGGKDGDLIKSSGRDDFLQIKADLDGIAAMAGVLPPLGIGIDLIDIGSGATNLKIGAQLDLLDIDAGPDFGITQNFELKPTLMVQLAFDNAVMIEGKAGPQTSWMGAWEDLPNMSVEQRVTTITPKFWLDAQLINSIGLDIGLSGTLDLFKFSFGASLGPISLLSTPDISLNSILGLGNELFATDKLDFNIWNKEFALGGFNMITAAPLVIRRVPEPGTLALLLIGFGALVLRRRGKRSMLFRRSSGLAA